MQPAHHRHRRRWLVAALVAAITAATTLAWAGYRAADAQLALAALWSLCAPSNR
ncbi:MAG TPA: hypothetical protein VIO33_18890 [Burkholderiaceae bacterium]